MDLSDSSITPPKAVYLTEAKHHEAHKVIIDLTSESSVTIPASQARGSLNSSATMKGSSVDFSFKFYKPVKSRRRRRGGANQKRHASDDSFVAPMPDFTFDDKTRSTGTNSTTRPGAVELEQEVWFSQQRHPLSRNKNRGRFCALPGEHETLANKMPGSSSGSQPPPSPELLSSSPLPPTREHKVGGDLAEEPEENEPKVLSAKRVERNIAKTQLAKQPNTVADLERVEVKPSFVDLLEDDREGRNNQAQQDKAKRPKDSKLRDLWTNSSTISRDTGPHLYPVLNSGRDSQMSSSLRNGAFKPRNSLTKEPFNLHEEHNRRSDNAPAPKRQKTHDAPRFRNPSSVDAVEAEASHRTRRPSTVPSGISPSYNEQGQNGTSWDDANGRIGEYVGLPSKLNPPKSRRRRRVSDNQAQTQGGSRQFGRLSSVGTVENLENPEDPIVDELSVVETKVKSSKLPRVEISEYQGTANRHPPRERSNTQYPRRSGPVVSEHFSNKESRQQPSTKNLNAERGRIPASRESNGDIDPLSTEHYQVAKKYLKKAQQEVLSKHPHPTRGHSHEEETTYHVPLDSSTDEDESNTRAKIHPSKLSDVKKKSGKASTDVPGETKCHVRMAFSEKQLWLVENSDAIWSLVFNESGSCLTLLDDKGENQWTRPAASVQKFEYALPASMVVLRTQRDMNEQGGVNIHLQLGNPDQLEALKEYLGYLSSSMARLEQPASHLRKIFSHTLEKAQDAINKRKIRSDEAEADDIKFLASNQAKRRIEHDEKNRERVSSIFQRSLDAKKPAGGSEPIPRDSRKVAESMRPIAPEVHQGGRQKPSTIDSRGFYSSTDNQAGAHFPTRASTRALAKILAPPSTKTPSPDLELGRWSHQNPDWQNSWKSSLIFPREGKDKASVDMQDIERLDEGEFLNDNLLVFYLRYLQANLQKNNPSLAKRVYFQNTFFYSRLTTNPPKSKRINYEAVERWTAKVDLLDYDYIIVPVNENSHWYVAIICNAKNLIVPDPEEVANIQSQNLTEPEGSISKPDNDEKSPSRQMEGMSLEDAHVQNGGNDPASSIPYPLPENERGMKKDLHAAGLSGASDDIDEPHEVPIGSDLVQNSKIASTSTPTEKGKGKGRRKSLPNRKINLSAPRIITLDSLGLAHSFTCTNLRDYLVAEIKSKKGIDVEPPAKMGHTVKCIPQQTNYCDCGLFLLMYIEMFLKKGDGFIHSLIQNSEDLTLDWPEASQLRSLIRDLLFKLQEEQVVENQRAREAKLKDKRAAKSDGRAIAAQKQESGEIVPGAVSEGIDEPRIKETVSKAKRIISESPDRTSLEERNRSSKVDTTEIEPPALSPADRPHEVITLDESQEISDLHDTATKAPAAVANPPQVKNTGGRSIFKLIDRLISSSQPEPQTESKQPESSVANPKRVKGRTKHFESTHHDDQQTRKPVREIQESPAPSGSLKRLHDETPKGVVGGINLRGGSRIPNQNTRRTRVSPGDQPGGPDNAIDLEEIFAPQAQVESVDRNPLGQSKKVSDDEEMLLSNDPEGKGGPDDPLSLSDSSPSTLRRSKGNSHSAPAQTSPIRNSNQRGKERQVHPTAPVNAGSPPRTPGSSSSASRKRKFATETEEEKSPRTSSRLNYHALDSSDHAIIGKRTKFT